MLYASGKYLEGIRIVSGFWKVSGIYQEGVWDRLSVERYSQHRTGQVGTDMSILDKLSPDRSIRERVSQDRSNRIFWTVNFCTEKFIGQKLRLGILLDLKFFRHKFLPKIFWIKRHRLRLKLLVLSH